MDRALVYPNELPMVEDFLGQAKNAYYAIGHLAEATIGSSPGVSISGFAIAPTSPASMSITIGRGSFYQAAQVDTVAYSTLSTDANSIVKQYINPAPQTLTLTAPATSGYSQYYVVQVGPVESDINAIVPPYINTANPLAPLNGVNNTGASQPTLRQDLCAVALKAGVAAPTGSQTVPAVDPGYQPLYVILVANGQTTITSTNWYTSPSAPFFPTLESLKTSFLPVIPATTLYVNNSTGNDSNPGTLALPFATIQGAVTYAAGYQSAVPVTINVAAGTGTMTIASAHTAANIPSSAISSWNIVGPGAGSLTIDASATGARGFVAYSGVVATISGFTIKPYLEGFAASGAGANITAHDCNIVLSSASAIAFASYPGGFFFAYGAWTISGSGYAMTLTTQGTARIAYHDVNLTQSATITFSSATFSAGVVASTDAGLVNLTSAYVTWSGTPTGPRYAAVSNGVIDTQGAATTWIPGTVAGTTATGGQYV